jgi:hypothetical protein
MDMNKIRIARALDENRNRRQALALLLHCSEMLRYQMHANIMECEHVARGMKIEFLLCQQFVSFRRAALGSTAPKTAAEPEFLMDGAAIQGRATGIECSSHASMATIEAK